MPLLLLSKSNPLCWVLIWFSLTEATSPVLPLRPQGRKACFLIRNARILDESEITSDRVNLGHTVKVMYMETGEVETYKIVGSNEADPLAGMISNESAIGRGLIGVGLDEEVQIEIPDGVVTLKVLEITRE